MGLLNALESARIFDLSQPYFVGMPHHPNHPPFLFGLTKRHGDFSDATGMSSAADSMAMSGHTGTHIDALNHFSLCGRFQNGDEVDPHQTYHGVASLSVDTIAPIVRRGVLLDIARAVAGDDALPADYVISPRDLELAAQGVVIEPGGIVLLRTGWARFWEDPRRYIHRLHAPGPALDGAQWLSSQRIFAAGSDTVAFEFQPAPAMPVHVHLLVESGIHIMENLNLEDLAAASVREFAFIAAPLRIRGGTGAPIRPLALVEHAS